MFIKKITLALTLLIFIICSNLTACTDIINEPDNIADNITETSAENGYGTNRDETQYHNIWNDYDFLIMTDYQYSYDGAPIVGIYERDNTGKMSVSEMLSSLDNIGNCFLPFTLDTVQGLYLKFSFNENIIPAEIKNIYYIKGNDETERYDLESLKVPEEIGVYNFFVNLQWNDGSEETVYFRAEVVESHSAKNEVNEEKQSEDVGLDRAFMSEIPMFIRYNWGFDWFKDKTELKPDEVSEMYLIYKTYLFEGNLGHTFERDESGYNWLIPEKAVRETVSYLCDIDPDEIIFNSYDKENPEYLRFSEAHSPNVSDFDILANTIRFENDIVRFDVNFYDITGNNDRGELLHTIRYEFSRSKYKDLISCYKFIKAVKLK